MDTITVAVIGCGRWGPNHIRVLNSFRHAKLKTVVDTDRNKLERVIENFPGVHGVFNYEEVLEDPEIDAVVIATPTGTHYSLIRKAIIAGKHVLCEKPLCETEQQGAELLHLASTHRRLLMVGHVFLFNPGITKVKDLVDAGELGSLQYLTACRMNLGPIRNDVNAAYDLASHDVSIFNWILGTEPELVSATGAAFLKPDIEDVVFISLRYPGNVLANIQASWLDPKKVRQMTVVGNQRMLTWDDLQSVTPVAIYDKGANAKQEYKDYGEFLHLSMWDGDVRLPKISLEEPLKVQDNYFLDCIRQGCIGRSDAAFSLGVVRVLEAVKQSLAKNGIPITLGKSAKSVTV